MKYTTAIAYVNGKLHIGHALEMVGSDVLARYSRQLGEPVFFSTGLDEHASKVVATAKAQGKTPQNYSDDIAKVIRAQVDSFGVKYDDFIRTSEPRHQRAVQAFWKSVSLLGLTVGDSAHPHRLLRTRHRRRSRGAVGCRRVKSHSACSPVR